MKNKYILYVEDDEIEVMKFKMTLESEGFIEDIKVAYNGEEGLNVLNENRKNLPKLIILDINMPKMNGLELLEKIKNDLDFSKIPVIMLTTSSNPNDVLKSYAQHVAGYFVKPFGVDEYRNILKVIKQYWENSLIVD